MLRKYLFLTVASMALVLVTAPATVAQTGELRGHITMAQADGTKVPAADAAVDVYRIDLPGKYNTKANKKGEFVFAGLPYVGDYIVVVSHPTTAPTWQQGVKVGRGVDYPFELSPGDGKRPTLDEVKAASAAGGGSKAASGSKDESAADRAAREEALRKNAEIAEKNKKIEAANAVVNRTFKAGNDALSAKPPNYDEAIRQYDEGLAADPEQPALLTNKALALKSRGIERFNAAILSKDDAAKTSGLQAAKADFKGAAEASTKAVELIKAQPAGTDPTEQQRYNLNKLAALGVRAESMRLFVSKTDPTKADDGMAAYQEYLAVETDPAKKSKAEHDAAQMLFDTNAFDRALVQYQKILEANPDDLDALLRSGQALFNIGAINNDKSKYQEAANYLARFVEKAPDDNALKADAKAILETLKAQENVKPERGTTPARRRTRP
jgi:tetratricopeptide (TPR) repeat protein